MSKLPCNVTSEKPPYTIEELQMIRQNAKNGQAWFFVFLQKYLVKGIATTGLNGG